MLESLSNDGDSHALEQGHWAPPTSADSNGTLCSPKLPGPAGRNGSGRGPDAGRTIECKETDRTEHRQCRFSQGTSNESRK
eukprot:gene18164-biopygen5392